uniref:tRNA methyltransferase 11 homolog n=1 Tax=Equus caballus TaxID=9796 RepID=A0A9L0RWW9_HORSE
MALPGPLNRYLLLMAQEHLEFRLPEIKSLLSLFGGQFISNQGTYGKLWILLVVACGTPPQRGLTSGVMSAPRIRTGETLDRQSGSPFWILSIPSEEIARNLMKRTVCAKKITPELTSAASPPLFLLRKTGPALTSTSIFLYFICGMPTTAWLAKWCHVCTRDPNRQTPGC